MSTRQLRVLIVASEYPLCSETYIEVERRFLDNHGVTHVVARNRVRRGKTPEHGSHLAKPSRWQMGRMLRQFRPDVVHGQFLHMAEWTARIARRAGVPWTLRTHSFDVLVRPEAERRRAAALANGSDCLGILGFPFARPILERLGLEPDKFVEAPPVADVNRFRSDGPTGEGILHFGAITAGKLAACAEFARLSTMVPELAFHDYPTGFGSGRELAPRVQAVVRQEGGRVETHDWVPHSEMPRVFGEHRWFVYPGPAAQTFGWPVGVVEAWAAGVGVCIQRIRPDIDEYVDGAAVVFDDIEELRSVLREEPDPGMVARGRERAETMDISCHGQRLLDVWRAAALSV